MASSARRRDADLVQKLKLSARQGVVVTKVVPTSPGGSSGLRVHDVILTFKDQPIGQPSDLAAAAQGLTLGETYPITINREGTQELLQLPWQEFLRPADRV